MPHDDDRPILVLNAGSSSLKLALFTRAGTAQLRGTLSGTQLVLTHGEGARQETHALPPAERPEQLLPDLLDILRAHGTDPPAAAGHRVVHGGPRHAGPARVTPALLEELSALAPLAPLHQERDLAPVRALSRILPDLPQVACFDTGFHHALPDPAARFAIPRALHDAGVRRYGAHGLSFEYIAQRLRVIEPALAAGRVVVAHLGSGASLCALQDGRSVDTTMGLTPLDGLVMATRCGALDPGVVLYLQQAHGLSADAVQDMLYHRAGLLGVSGISGDVRDLLASPDPRAAQAVALFVARLAKEIAAMAAGMDGIDALVFTGGIGQHSPPIRAAAAERLRLLGIKIDRDANAGNAERIETPASTVAVFVLPTDEEAVIARQTATLLGDAWTA